MCNPGEFICEGVASVAKGAFEQIAESAAGAAGQMIVDSLTWWIRTPSVDPQTPAVATAQSKMDAKDALQGAMRKLWIDHVTWTRLYIVSAAANLPDKDATTQQLLQNQTDIGNAVATYYGQDAGNKLTALLKGHILIAADLVAAAKAGNTGQVTAINTRWQVNADSIATFLHNANPKNWPEATLKSAMRTHLDQTLTEASDHLTGNYAAYVKDYDAIEQHIIGMADGLSSGIIAQFRQKFRDKEGK